MVWGVAAGCGRGGGLYGLHLFVGEFLRLVAYEDVRGEASARAFGAGDEFDAAAVGQYDGFLSVRVPDVVHRRREFGVLAGVLEVVLHSQEVLAAGLDLVGGVQDFQAEYGGVVQFKEFDDAVLAVLARHAYAAVPGGPSAVLEGAHPSVEDEPLPRVGRHAVAFGECGGVGPVAVRVAGCELVARLLPSFEPCRHS